MSAPIEPAEPIDALADLALGSRCVGCERPGRVLCPSCRGRLPQVGSVAWPSPTPPGLAPPYAMGPYEGTARAMVLGLKEDRLWGLAGPLATLLAGAVRGLCEEIAVPGPIVLVPVPSRPASVRARALDSTWAITRTAARTGNFAVPVLAASLLQMRPQVADQSGLDARARARNLDRSMRCSSAGLRRLARHTPRASVVICDDVMTTGSTAREAQRALEAVGVSVAGIAAVAATVKRFSG